MNQNLLASFGSDPDSFQCKACGAVVRTGEPHSAREPYPHRTLEALIVRARIVDCGSYDTAFDIDGVFPPVSGEDW